MNRNKKGMFIKGHTPPLKDRKMSKKGLENVIKAHRRKDYKGKGENHYHWKGTHEFEEVRRSSWQYEEMRKKVLERDNYTCVLCGCKDKKKLRVDHIKPFIFYPKLRWDVNNCRTLCRKCDFKYGFNYLRDKNNDQFKNEK